MKKVLAVVIITIMAVGCSQPDQKDNTASQQSDDMNALYEANLATLKTQIGAFEKEDVNAWAATIADSAVWLSPVYGDTITTKAHWEESIKNIMDNNSNLHLSDAQFLPGVDSATQKPDGSVRYYGTWHGTPTSGKEVSVKFYGTYDFNDNHKIISGDDFYDVGGLMNSLKPQ
ncbi:MAG: hypothetical protein ABI594_18560 [Ginsengibacter sp.]